MPRRWDVDPFEKKKEPADEAEREKRSWRDIDKMRDRAGHGRDDRHPPRQKKDRQTAAYGKYKAELHRLFDKGGIAEKFKHVLAADQGSDEKTSRLKALRAADGVEFFRLLSAFDKDYGMPDAPDVLVKATTGTDVNLVKKAVARLVSVAAGARIPGKSAMLERLRALDAAARDPELTELVAKLRAVLGI
ncbi:MAG: hypothetical protein HY897_10055 [Deltaproteobacteria bacterium]|nr:hypothetical protein [Deltaproteobacteria bacterium]